MSLETLKPSACLQLPFHLRHCYTAWEPRAAFLRGETQTFAFAMLIFAVAAAGTIIIGIMPRTSFLSLPFCELEPCRELLCGGLHRCRIHVKALAAPAQSDLYLGYSILC